MTTQWNRIGTSSFGRASGRAGWLLRRPWVLGLVVVVMRLAAVAADRKEDVKLGAEIPASRQSLHADGATWVGTEGWSATVDRAFREADGAMSRAAEIGKRVALRFKEGGGPRTFVLPGAAMSADDSDLLNEDLAVMSRILEKAAAPVETGESWTMLGRRWGGIFGKEMDAFYLDGFGALFLLQVDYPLVAPVAKKAEKVAEASDQTWEEARREVLGTRGGAERRTFWNSGGGLAAPEYDAKRVDELKAALIQSLKHATHLRGVSENNSIVVSVFGPGSPRSNPRTVAFSPDGRMIATQSEAGRNVRVWDVATGEPLDGPQKMGSVLTLRVKKSDVDALASGQLSAEAFGTKVEVRLR